MTNSDPVRPIVQIPKRFGPLMQLVARGRSSKQAVFASAFELVCFSAAVGFTHGLEGSTSQNSDDKTTGGEVSMENPERDDRVLCDMIAIAETDSDEILADGRLQERLDIFMKYACGGMDHMLQLVAEGRHARDAVELIIRNADKDSSVEELSAFVDLKDHA